MQTACDERDLEVLLRDVSRHPTGRKRGRPSIPHREWLRAEVSRDLVNLLRREAELGVMTVTDLMAVVLCDRYGVKLGSDNQILGPRKESTGS